MKNGLSCIFCFYCIILHFYTILKSHILSFFNPLCLNHWSSYNIIYLGLLLCNLSCVQ